MPSVFLILSKLSVRMGWPWCVRGTNCYCECKRTAVLLTYIVIAFGGILVFNTEVPSTGLVPQILVAEFDARGKLW